MRINRLIVFTLFLTGCFYDELEKATVPAWSPSFAIPLVSSEFTAGDLLSSMGPDGYLSANDDDVIVLSYERVLFSASAGEVFQIPPVRVRWTDVASHVSLPFDFPEGDILAHLALRNGELTYTLEWENPADAEIILTLPQATKDGEVLTESFVTRVTQQQYTGTLDLSGYAIDFDTSEGINLLHIFLQALRDDEVVNPQFDALEMQLEDLAFSEVQGQLRSLQFGRRSDTLDLGLTRNWVSGSVAFVNPKIQISARSGFDLPFLVSLDNFKALGNTTALQLAGSIVDAAWSVPEASDAGMVSDSLVAGPANSNVVDFLSISPSRIAYQLNVNAQVTAGEMVTLHDDDRITVTAGLEVPFECMIQDAVLLDTFDVEIPAIEKLRSMELKVWFENAFPHTLSAQLFLADEAGEILHALLPEDERIMTAAQTDAAGRVVAANERTTVIPFTTATLGHLPEMHKIILRVGLVTAEGGAKRVQYTTENRLRCRISAQATVAP